MKTIKEKQIDSFSVLKEKFGYKNKLSSPHITKVIVSCDAWNYDEKRQKQK